jgi:hypothetical protein
MPKSEPVFAPDGPLALSAARRQMDYLRALIEYHHPKIASDADWQTFAGLAQEIASDAAVPKL